MKKLVLICFAAMALMPLAADAQDKSEDVAYMILAKIDHADLRRHIRKKTSCRNYDDLYKPEDAYKNTCNCMYEESKKFDDFQFEQDRKTGELVANINENEHRIKIDTPASKLPLNYSKAAKAVQVRVLVMEIIYPTCQEKVKL